MSRYIVTEIECDECGGDGSVEVDGQMVKCSGCDGSGYIQERIELKKLKKLLEDL